MNKKLFVSVFVVSMIALSVSAFAIQERDGLFKHWNDFYIMLIEISRGVSIEFLNVNSSNEFCFTGGECISSWPVGGGGSGSSKWVDGGTFIYPNTSYADDVIIYGDLKVHTSNISAGDVNGTHIRPEFVNVTDDLIVEGDYFRWGNSTNYIEMATDYILGLGTHTNLLVMDPTGYSQYSPNGVFSFSPAENYTIQSLFGQVKLKTAGDNIILDNWGGDIIMQTDGALRPSTTGVLDFGTPDYKYKDFYISGQIMAGSPVNFLEGIELRERDGLIPYIQSNTSQVYINDSLNVSTNITAPKYCLEGDCITEWPTGGAASSGEGVVTWFFRDSKFHMQVS